MGAALDWLMNKDSKEYTGPTLAETNPAAERRIRRHMKRTGCPAETGCIGFFRSIHCDSCGESI